MEQLKINSKRVEKKLINFIRGQAAKAGVKKIALGLSGGLDSSVVLYLSVQAVGPENVLGLIMPYKTSLSQGINYAKLLARKYQVKVRFIDITGPIDSYFKNFSQADRVRRGNKMARERMATLYDQSKSVGAIVAGTGNKTEALLGYTTMYGDMACAFNPIGGLYKTQLRQFARDVGIPDEIIKQKPTAGLWPGQTDEGELGITYTQADKLLFYLVDKKYSDKKLLNLGFKKSVIEKVKKRMAANAFKRCLPPVARI